MGDGRRVIATAGDDGIGLAIAKVGSLAPPGGGSGRTPTWNSASATSPLSDGTLSRRRGAMAEERGYSAIYFAEHTHIPATRDRPGTGQTAAGEVLAYL